MRYNKEFIEDEAVRSVAVGRMSEALGEFTLQRSIEIAGSAFITDDAEVKQALIDAAVMRVLEKFFVYYVEGKSAANLIIGMIYSTMTNKIVSLNWKDVYGQNIKGYVTEIEDGKRVKRLVRYVKDSNLSEKM